MNRIYQLSIVCTEKGWVIDLHRTDVYTYRANYMYHRKVTVVSLINNHFLPTNSFCKILHSSLVLLYKWPVSSKCVIITQQPVVVYSRVKSTLNWYIHSSLYVHVYNQMFMLAYTTALPLNCSSCDYKYYMNRTKKSPKVLRTFSSNENTGQCRHSLKCPRSKMSHRMGGCVY